MAAERAHPHKISEEDYISLWEILKQCTRREDALTHARDGLADQINRQNVNMHQLGAQGQRTQLALNTANKRCENYERACGELQRGHAELNNQLHEERQNHNATNMALDHELKVRAKMEQDLERYWSILRKLSEFMTRVSIASSGDRSVMLDGLRDDEDLGHLMLELDEKKECISALEKRLTMEKQGREEAIAELEGRRVSRSDHQMTDVEAEVPGKRRPRSNRKSAQAFVPIKSK